MFSKFERLLDDDAAWLERVVLQVDKTRLLEQAAALGTTFIFK
nr:hypothetical protein [uncultured Pseudogulbenkiania sp.]